MLNSDAIKCHRSNFAPSQVAIDRLKLDMGDIGTDIRIEFTNVACSGATINAGLLASYEGVFPSGNLIKSQIDQARDFLDETLTNSGLNNADIVLLTIGGNDVGFGAVVGACALYKKSGFNDPLLDLPSEFAPKECNNNPKLQQLLDDGKERGAFSEAVFVTFDTQKIDLKDIIEIHLYTHSSTANHAMRKKYRSAVYAMSKEDQKQLGLLLTELQKEFKESLVTRALLFKDFKKSEEQYLDYYYKNPDKPFCQTYIQPKLKMLLQKYPNIVDDTVNDMGDLLITNKPSN